MSQDWDNGISCHWIHIHNHILRVEWPEWNALVVENLYFIHHRKAKRNQSFTSTFVHWNLYFCSWICICIQIHLYLWSWICICIQIHLWKGDQNVPTSPSTQTMLQVFYIYIWTLYTLCKYVDCRMSPHPQSRQCSQSPAAPPASPPGSLQWSHVRVVKYCHYSHILSIISIAILLWTQT